MRRKKLFVIVVLVLVVVALLTYIVIRKSDSESPSLDMPGSSDSNTGAEDIIFAANGIMLPSEEGILKFVCDNPIDIEFENRKFSDVNEVYIYDLNISSDMLDKPLFVKAAKAAYDGEEIRILPMYFLGEDICIPMNYAMLHYPGEWVDNLNIETDINTGTMTFFGQIGEKEYKLFSIFPDDSGEVPVGKFERSGYEPIIISFTAYASPEGLNENEQECYYAMAEGLNYMVNELQFEVEFTPEI